MKKILIALDYNPTSQKVAEAGYALAKSMGAEVILLHILVNETLYTNTYDYMGAWQFDIVETIKTVQIRQAASVKFLAKVKKHLADDTIQTIHKEGDFAQQILETSVEIKADCIVMGSHSQKWLENILMLRRLSVKV